MFPVGALVGGLLAARRAPGPTKARIIGIKYVAQGRPGTQLAMSVMLWCLASSIGSAFLLTRKNSGDVHAAVISMSVLVLVLSPLVLSAYGRHLLFDAQGIEAISWWHKRRSMLYRDVVRIRRNFTNDGFVLYAADGVTLRVQDSLGGWTTLASQLLQHVPARAWVSLPAKGILSSWAAAEPP